MPPYRVIEGEQVENKDKERNHRIVAVEQDAHSWADIKSIDDLVNNSVENWKNSL